jgi:hypothetical protein
MEPFVLILTFCGQFMATQLNSFMSRYSKNANLLNFNLTIFFNHANCEWFLTSCQFILKVRKTQEGGLNCVLKNSSFLLKTEHTDQKLSETASEVMIRI